MSAIAPIPTADDSPPAAADGVQQILEGTAHELIVVHDMDDGVFQHLASHSPFEGD